MPEQGQTTYAREGSPSPALVIDGVDCAQRLPRGRHGIPRELVNANQCQRQMAATSALIAERGYAALRVGDITARAGVSRATFYKFFDDKFDVLLATQRWALDGLDEAMGEACASAAPWPRQVAAAVEAAIRFCLDSPGPARLLHSTAFADFEPRLVREGVALPQHLHGLLRDGAARYPAARDANPLLAEAAVCTVISLFGAGLREGGEEPIAALAPTVTELLLAPYLGSAEAKRFAPAA